MELLREKFELKWMELLREAFELTSYMVLMVYPFVEEGVIWA